MAAASLTHTADLIHRRELWPTLDGCKFLVWLVLLVSPIRGVVHGTSRASAASRGSPDTGALGDRLSMACADELLEWITREVDGRLLAFADFELFGRRVSSVGDTVG